MSNSITLANGGAYITLGAVLAASVLGSSGAGPDLSKVSVPQYVTAVHRSDYGAGVSYHTSFDKFEYRILPRLSDLEKLNMMKTVVADITVKSTPLTKEEHKLLSDNLFDLI